MACCTKRLWVDVVHWLLELVVHVAPSGVVVVEGIRQGLAVDGRLIAVVIHKGRTGHSGVGGELARSSIAVVVARSVGSWRTLLQIAHI